MDAEKRILSFALAQLRRREFLKLAALSAGGSLLAACAPTAPAGTATEAGTAESGAAAAPPQVLRYPLTNEATGNWDYTLSGGSFGLNMGLELMDGLTQLDVTTGLPAPKVAESWEFNEDGSVCTFTLRSDVTWSDGTPVTAHDFEFAIKRNFDPAAASQYAWALYQIAGGEDYNTGVTTDPETVGVKALDDAHLEITLRETACPSTGASTTTRSARVTTASSPAAAGARRSIRACAISSPTTRRLRPRCVALGPSARCSAPEPAARHGHARRGLARRAAADAVHALRLPRLPWLRRSDRRRLGADQPLPSRRT